MRTRWMMGAALAAVALVAPLSAQDHGAHASHTAQPASSGDAADVAAITAVVNTLFDGMRAGDSAMVRSVFHPANRMVTTFRNRENQPQVAIEESLDGFVQSIGTPHDEIYDEKIWDLVVKVDADLGMAWMNYGFYLGEQFSHCGVNMMELVRTPEGWKIIHLADTRRRQGCEVPERAGSGN